MSTGPPACGWLRGTSRTSPGPPRRRRRPIRLRSTSARGRGFAAYLSACGGQPLQRPRCGLRQGGLRSLRSASSLPFLVTCQRQVIPSHSFAARTRACCAPRKRYCGLICALRKWLYRPPRYLARAGTLACAPGSGTLPPHPAAALCRRFALSSDVRSEGAGLPPCRGVVKAGARSPRPCDGEGAGIFPQKSGKMRKADAVRRVPGFLALLALLPFKSLPKVKQGVFRHCRKTPCARTGTLPVWGAGGEASPLGAGGKAPGRRRHSPVIFAYGVLQRERGGDILSGKTERVDDGFSA